jgi:hypothetical protein
MRLPSDSRVCKTRTRSAAGGNEPARGRASKEILWKEDEARQVACRRDALSAVRGADAIKTKKGGCYAEPWVPVQEKRERQLDRLDRGNSAGSAVAGAGVSISEILMIKG